MKQEKTVIQNVTGKVDWLQIVCQNISWRDVFTNLLQISLDCVSLQPAYLKHEEYEVMYSCGSIKYYTFSDSHQSFLRGTLILSGQGCTMYEWATLASSPFSLVFQELAWQFHQLAIQTQFTFEVKRLDLALDDYNQKPFFSMDLIIGKTKRRQFLSKGRQTKLIDSEFDKKTRAKTQQIGVRGSNCLFRFYEKAKELSRGLSGEALEKVMAQAPSIRLEAETRKNTANELFGTLAYLTKEHGLANLIRGFIQTELMFYSDTTYKTTCRWWLDYLQPSALPEIRPQFKMSDFENTLNWYKYQGGFAITQAIYFLINQGVEVDYELIGIKEDYQWTSELAEKLIEFVTQEKRFDLVPLIQRKIKNHALSRT